MQVRFVPDLWFLAFITFLPFRAHGQGKGDEHVST